MMRKDILWRVVLIISFFFLALVLFLPSTPLSKHLPSFWREKFPKIALGLDLQGGMHLVLEVDSQKAVENHTQRLTDNIEAILKEKKVGFGSVKAINPIQVAIAYPPQGDKSAIEKIMGDNFPILRKAGERERELIYTLIEREIERVKDWATTQALETIRNRVDKFGVREPV
ncbi:MAG: protein translocase subunit SecD, partial [Deltaproteobacteria bacterium]|nr:protein translocase subunit SecD [Deltaproteobacteria bacterium]